MLNLSSSADRQLDLMIIVRAIFNGVFTGSITQDDDSRGSKAFSGVCVSKLSNLIFTEFLKFLTPSSPSFKTIISLILHAEYKTVFCF